MGKLSKSLLKPAAAGAISAVVSYIMFDGADSVQIMDNFVPGWLLIGVVVAVADFAGTFSANYISPYIISSSESVKNLEDMLLTPSLCGALSWILLDPVLGVGESFMASFGTGLVSSWAADYIINKWDH